MAKSKFILGAILGAAAAALLTPVTGRKAREKLVKLGEGMGFDSDIVKKKVDEFAREGAAILQEAVGARRSAKRPVARRSQSKTNSKNK